jgi:hypothetical protein
MFRRFIVMTFGFTLAAGAGALFLPIAALFDPVTRDAGLGATMAGIFAMLGNLAEDAEPEAAIWALGFVFWAILIATCVAPLAAAALIGEIAGMRGWIWYAGASGFLAAASPWIARAAHGLERARSANALEGRFALLFFLTGVVTGGVYWLIAVRGARPERVNPPPKLGA